jgi:hypothetical protein
MANEWAIKTLLVSKPNTQGNSSLFFFAFEIENRINRARR